MLNSAGDQPADKTNTLKKILRNFQPVFRKFFEENYRDPQVWFERRQAYTKSVATMAIVGWIVGECLLGGYWRQRSSLCGGLTLSPNQTKGLAIGTSTTCCCRKTLESWSTLILVSLLSMANSFLCPRLCHSV